jgi:hypothetical protein
MRHLANELTGVEQFAEELAGSREDVAGALLVLTDFVCGLAAGWRGDSGADAKNSLLLRYALDNITQARSGWIFSQICACH